MVSLGHKLKMLKGCEKRFYKHIRVVLCKKAVEKTPNIEINETFLKISHLAKTISHVKAIGFAK